MATAKAQSDKWLVNGALVAVVAGYCAWVFSLPLFPTQDGAVHLYYAQVISRLLSGSPLYSQFFALRMPVPPYALHYLLLLFLTKLFSPLVAEKCIVCLFIAGFVYAFRALAGRLGPSTDLATIWIVPLSLNWMLGMGFHNYCLSLVLGLLAMAAWLGAVQLQSWRAWAWYSLLLVLMLFTHPVPLVITVAFISAELLLRIGQRWLSARDECTFTDALRHFRTEILFASLSFLPLLYVALFIKPVSATTRTPYHVDWRTALRYANLKTLSLIGKTPVGYVYRASLYAVLACALVLALRGFRDRFAARKLKPSDIILFICFALAIALPCMPRSMNGSDFFSDRLVIYIWIGGIAAAASRPIGSLTARRLAFGGGVAFASMALFATDRHVRPIADQVALLENVRTPAPGLLGMFLDPPTEHEPDRVSFDPYVWSAARYFRQTDTVMLNAPWLDLPILPLAPKGKELAAVFSNVTDYPDRFRRLLVDSRAAKSRVVDDLQFVLVVDNAKTAEPDPLAKSLWPLRVNCQEVNWQSKVCEPSSQLR